MIAFIKEVKKGKSKNVSYKPMIEVNHLKIKVDHTANLKVNPINYIQPVINFLNINPGVKDSGNMIFVCQYYRKLLFIQMTPFP